MSTVIALVITPSGHRELREVETSLDSLQGLVGGMIEAVDLPDHDAHLYCNEEGKLNGLPVNARATVLADRLRPGFADRDLLCGTVVFLGSDPTGGENNVPQAVIDLAGKEAL